MSARLIEVMREVQADCERDVMANEGKPFTGANVGAQFGNTLAMVQAVARGVEVLAERLDATDRVIASWTDHLV